MKLNTTPLKNIPLGIPVVSDGLYYALMTAEVKENRAGDNNNLVIRYRIIDPDITLRATGEKIPNPGNAIITRYIPFVKDEADEEQVARFNRAVKENAVAGGMDEDSEEDVDLDHLNNKVVKANIKFDEGTNGFPDKNRVAFASPLAEDEEPPAYAE